ncbi:hypothetical protein [Shinella granuli]
MARPSNYPRTRKGTLMLGSFKIDKSNFGHALEAVLIALCSLL